jgi:hypothetical protein
MFRVTRRIEVCIGWNIRMFLYTPPFSSSAQIYPDTLLRSNHTIHPILYTRRPIFCSSPLPYPSSSILLLQPSHSMNISHPNSPVSYQMILNPIHSLQNPKRQNLNAKKGKGYHQEGPTPTPSPTPECFGSPFKTPTPQNAYANRSPRSNS